MSAPLNQCQTDTTERSQCTLCAKLESSGFYTGCMIQDGHGTDYGWQCDGNGNLTRAVLASEPLP